MAELTTAAETTANSCCAPEQQATCCEPSAKAECCDPSHGEGCGCAADTTTTQAGDVREQVLLSVKRVGPTGKAHGLDMTDEMLALARENAQKAGVENVEFHKGYIEEIPLPDASVTW